MGTELGDDIRIGAVPHRGLNGGAVLGIARSGPFPYLPAEVKNRGGLVYRTGGGGGIRPRPIY